MGRSRARAKSNDKTTTARRPLQASVLAVAVSLALYGPGTRVIAQPDDELDSQDDPSLEEILVFGLRGTQLNSTRMPLTLMETPQSISVLTSESLAARQVTTLGQALELSAGVTQFSGNGPFAGQPSFGFNQTTIRGIQIDDIYDFRQDGFINGSYFALPDLAIYERIEVIKGPNSMLFGRGSPGGIINRITKKPEKVARGEIGVDIGSFDTYRMDVDVTGQVVTSPSIQGRLVAAYEDAETFVRGPKTETTVLAPSANFDLSPTTRLLLTGLYQSQDIIPNTGLPLLVDGDNFEAPDINRRQYNGVVTRDPYTWKIESFSAQLEQAFADRWLATLRLNKTSIDTPIAVDAYAYSYGGVEPDGDVTVTANEFNIDRDVWSGELQVAGQVDVLGRDATVGAGVDWNENEYSRRGAYAYAPELGNIYTNTFPLPDRDNLSPGFATQSKPVSTGAFAQARVPLTDRLAVLLGARYDNVDYNTIPYYPLLGDEPPREKGNVDKVTGRVGATYELAPDMMIYSLYSQSFSPELDATDANGKLLEPQTGELYEVGLKKEWFDGRLGLSTAVYRIDRENIATSVPDNPNDDIPPYSIASGLQRSDGYEVELNGEPLPGWIVSMAFNNVDSAYKDPTDFLYGRKPGGAANWQVGAFTTYELQSGPLQGFGFGASYFAIDDRGVGYLPGTIPGYERTDLHFFYNGFDKTEINVVVRNVTSAHYIEGADRPSAYAQFGSPTAVMLTVRRQLF